MQGAAEEGAGSIEFSETGEFVKAVQAYDEEEAESDLPSVALRKANEAAAAGKLKQGRAAGKEEGGKVKVKEEKVKVKVEEGAGPSSSGGGWQGGVGGEVGSGDEGGEEGEEEEEEEEDEQLMALHDRPAAHGLAAALMMAKTRGMLGEEKQNSGRVFDMKGAGLHNYEGGDEEPKKGGVNVNLNYYDEYGRKMTQKEAFRQLSWKFHGKAPSKKRREKRMAEVEAQMNEQKQDRAMEYMGVLQRAQVSTKSAHVVISGAHAIKATEVTVKQARPQKEAGKKKAKLQ